MLSTQQLTSFHNNGFLILESIVASHIVDLLQQEGHQLLKVLSDKEGQNWQSVLQSRGCIVEPLQSCFEDAVIAEARLNKQKYKEIRIKVDGSSSIITDFILGSFMKSIVESLLCTSTNNVYLVCVYVMNLTHTAERTSMYLCSSSDMKKYIMKPPSAKDTKFEYHQDREYFAHRNVPYVSCWIALDDMYEKDNGCLYIVPYPNKDIKKYEFSTPQKLMEHHEMHASFYQSKEHYQMNQEDNIEDNKEIPVLVPKGSLVILACTVLHRSGSNLSKNIRRAFMPQYSTDIIRADNGTPVALGIPLE